jgi:hypothetical protein
VFFPCSELVVQALLSHDQTVQCNSATIITIIMMHANIRSDFLTPSVGGKNLEHLQIRNFTSETCCRIRTMNERKH